jgi:long-chain acyl-CoA synthetase
VKELIYHRQFFPAVERNAERIGFIDGAYTATFDDHADRVLRLVHAMRKQLDVQAADRYAVLARNGHQFMELCQAAALGAGVVNPLNVRLSALELRFILQDSASSVVFVDDHFKPLLEEAIAGTDLVRTIVHLDAPEGGLSPYEELLAAGEAVIPAEPEEDDLAILAYTSGTTAQPKGVMITHRAEMLNTYHMSWAFPMGRDARFLFQIPMFHAGALGCTFAVPAEGAVSIFNPTFDPELMMATVESERVSHCFMVPTMLGMLFRHAAFSSERLASLTDLLYGASPMPSAILAETNEHLPDVRLYQGYGMTEACAFVCCLTPGDHLRGGRILRSAGRPVRGVDVTIQDTAGEILPPGQTGEVCVRGGNLSDGYWARPEATEAAFRHGWYHSGDAGYCDDEGYVYLVDRVKDMIVTGGENVASAEVENAIASHPAVAQVAVFGIPDELWGEAVHALVVPREGQTVTPDEIRDHARSQIAGFKVPKSVDIRTEPLPLSGSLKVMKRELREPYWRGHTRAIN